MLTKGLSEVKLKDSSISHWLHYGVAKLSPSPVTSVSVISPGMDGPWHPTCCGLRRLPSPAILKMRNSHQNVIINSFFHIKQRLANYSVPPTPSHIQPTFNFLLVPTSVSFFFKLYWNTVTPIRGGSSMAILVALTSCDTDCSAKPRIFFFCRIGGHV